MAELQYDVVIVGGGPAGLTAAIYTSRRALKTLVITKDVGGQLTLTNDIENYPGFESIGGQELSQKFHDQAGKFGAEYKYTEATAIKKIEGGFELHTAANEVVTAKVIILAFGLTPRNLDVPGEKELTGRGVTYCATCDGPLYKGKTVAVIGGGNSALDAAEFLSKICTKVYLVHRRDAFRGEQVLIDKVLAEKNIEVIYNAATKEVKGNNKVESVVLDIGGDEKIVPVEGIFVEIGHVAKTDWLEDIVTLTPRREIIINRDNETSTPGIFAAGDITDISYKQAVISAGEGSKAALQAYKFIQGDKPVVPDWKKA